MLLNKGQLVKSIVVKRSVMRHKIIAYQGNPMTNIVMGVIAFGIIYDVMDTFRKHKKSRDVIEPLVVEEDMIDDDHSLNNTYCEEGEFMSKKQNIVIEFTEDDIHVILNHKEDHMIDIIIEDKTNHE